MPELSAAPLKAAQPSPAVPQTFAVVHFLGLDFALACAEDWLRLLLRPAAPDGFDYLVTPNVDHVVQLNKRPELAPVYDAASWHVCDSRILEKLARLRGIDLCCYPGADLVADLLADPRSCALKIAVIGPDAADFARLKQVLPGHDFVHVSAPMMQPGCSAWQATLAASEATGADLHLVCLSFPKQEIFAHDLKLRARARGRALCVGAGIDFLTGHQKRAPRVWRRLSLEWLYRLLSQPRRMWKRYLVDGPKIFWIFLRQRRG